MSKFKEYMSRFTDILKGGTALFLAALGVSAATFLVCFIIVMLVAYAPFCCFIVWFIACVVESW